MMTRTFDILELYKQEHILTDALAGVRGGTWVKYSGADYVRLANQCSYAFLSLGLQPGDRVATVSNNRPEWNFTDMGLAQAGLIHVPLYPTISLSEYEYILNHVQPVLLIVSDRALYEKLKPLADRMPFIRGIYTFNEVEGAMGWNALVERGAELAAGFAAHLEKLKDSIKPDDIVSIIYTSGTTGVPKGVMLSHGNFMSNVLASVHVHNMGYGCRALSFLPISHVYERMLNYHYQYKGVAIYYAESLGTLIENIREVRPHLFVTVPRVLERLYDAILKKAKELGPVSRFVFQSALRFALSYEPYERPGIFTRMGLWITRTLVFHKWIAALGGEVQIIVSGGAAVQTRLIRVFSAAGITMVEGYGLTETSPVVAVGNPVKKLMKVGTVGPPLDGVEVQIAPDGEILVRGPNVMKGYYKDPELTRQVIDEQGFFHTGDIGRMEDGLYLKITDRKKEIFKLSNGKYVAPQALENILKESPFVDQAMVIGEGEKFASALISPNFAYLKDFCKEHHIQCGEAADMVRHPGILAAVQKEIAGINKMLGRTEQIKRFRMVPHEWCPATGELSPTLKLRRKFLMEKYQQVVEEIYAPSRRNGNDIDD